MEPGADDVDAVAHMLGRDPGGAFTVAVRGEGGRPLVIANDPFLRDGTPMPTRYWLVDPELRARVGRVEAAGGVREAAREVDEEALADGHRRYAAERDALDSRRVDGTPPERGSGWHAPGGQVPSCPPGLVVGRRRRRRRGVGGGPAESDPPGDLSAPAL